MKNPLHSGNPHDWDGLPLTMQLDLIRRDICTGPCGQSSSVMRQRERIAKALREAMLAVHAANIERTLTP